RSEEAMKQVAARRLRSGLLLSIVYKSVFFSSGFTTGEPGTMPAAPFDGTSPLGFGRLDLHLKIVDLLLRAGEAKEIVDTVSHFSCIVRNRRQRALVVRRIQIAGLCFVDVVNRRFRIGRNLRRYGSDAVNRRLLPGSSFGFNRLQPGEMLTSLVDVRLHLLERAGIRLPGYSHAGEAFERITVFRELECSGAYLFQQTARFQFGRRRPRRHDDDGRRPLYILSTSAGNGEYRTRQYS